MPLDPRIPLGVQPAQIANPFEQFAQLQHLRGQAEERQANIEERRAAGEARRAAAQAAAEKRAREAALHTAIASAIEPGPDGQPTFNPARLLEGKVDPAILPDALATIHKSMRDLQELRTADLDADTKKLQYNAALARGVEASGYDPTIFGAALLSARQFGSITPEDAETGLPLTDTGGDAATLAQNRAAIQRAAHVAIARGGGAVPKLPALGTLEDYVTRYAASVGKTPDTLTPTDIATARSQFEAAGRAPAAGPAIGTFEDYMQRDAAQRNKPLESYTTQDIDALRETFRLDPRITVNTGGARPLTPTAALTTTRQLRNDFTRETAAARTIEAQLANMKSSLEAVRKGAAPAGSQGVLVTFQKILDPSSVVRESEYARSASGLSLLGRLEGQWMKLGQGGAGVTTADLEQFVNLADQYAQNQRRAAAETKTQIDAIATEFRLKPELITREIGAPPTDTAARPPGETRRQQTYAVGQILTVKRQKVRVTKLLPNGQYEGEPVP